MTRGLVQSGINVDTNYISLDAPVRVVRTDDYAYAARLIYAFVMLWKQAIPAAQRIEQLLKEGLQIFKREAYIPLFDKISFLFVLRFSVFTCG
ncbi:MAG TPA: hypothetical protein VED16_00235 [Candidatus Acidoferrum sp.]|nr:hypothetical protein [Candidatus Acidoferrum sp.]